jgi:hypothetical protein
VLPGLYGAPDLDLAQLLAAARVRHGDEAVAVLDSAAALHELPTPWPCAGDVHVALPPGREQVQRPGHAFHTWKLRADETCVVDGHRVTTLARTLVDLVCLRDRFSAVSALDAALRSGRVERTDLVQLRSTTVRRRGAARGRDWWLAADPRAESPLETRVRLRACDAGYPPDELQRRFELSPGVAYADLAWRMPDGRWLVVEADGASWHSAPAALYVDRARSNALLARGDVVVLRVVWADTVDVGRIAALLRRFLGPPRTAVG